MRSVLPPEHGGCKDSFGSRLDSSRLEPFCVPVLRAVDWCCETSFDQPAYVVAPSSSETCSMALTITGLSKTYPNGVRALKNLSLSVGSTMFGLLGPNGAGKSSLMRTIATLQDPDSGSISLDGIDVLRQKDAVRRTLGYLPQEFGVYPKISALDMLRHLAVMKGINSSSERKEMVDALLHQTNLWESRKKALATFSGGMKQRFGIAQALLG